jgi:thiamine kinase-like enzyme
MALDQVVALDAVAALCDATAVRYRLIGRLAGGETGAHEIAGPDDDRFVLKWETDPESQVLRRRGADLAERLRVEAAWPVPRQQVVEHEGWLFVIQELLNGAPITTLTHPIVDQLLELHERRLALRVPEPDDRWPAELLRTLVVGGRGYCHHESLRSYDQRTARLVERIEEIGRSIDPAELPGGEIVHWDWHPGNLLQSDGRLRAVVDTDFVTTGDARFDLVTLAMSSLEAESDPGVRERLEHVALDELTAVQRAAYVGHLLVRFLDWPIRGRRDDEIEVWLSHADRLLGS